MANQSPTIGWQREVGINMVGAYQVSGRPFASGSINASTAQKVQFPYVTRWVTVINSSAQPVRVGFSQNGVSGSHTDATYYFVVPKADTSNGGQTSSGRLELKVSELWLYSPGVVSDVSVIAGLTTINHNKTSGSAGPSWSGSVGVG
jgi:hypothetical protein